MPIITISRGSYSRGKEVAEQLAARLNYECVSRDIILEASREFNIPEIRLVRALHDSSSVLDRLNHGRERYLKYYRSALLKHLKKDNVVYHGLAGHYFLQDISHVIKVRIIADMKERVREEMKREDISAQAAFDLLRKDDDERRKWGKQVYGVDTWDSRLYDMVINIKSVSIDDAVDILSDLSAKPVFQPTPQSREQLEQKAMLAEIEAYLADFAPTARCSLEKGVLSLANVGDALKSNQEMRERVTSHILTYEAIDEVRFDKPVAVKKDYINTFHNIDYP